ncbi:hypothetical protein QOZ80_3AG0251130 [Eleusine coracana subsp. coracana]|nr:hypothetical protein QOZ80_3AG0251130 [Eleusine coracana subsp. coracana]
MALKKNTNTCTTSSLLLLVLVLFSLLQASEGRALPNGIYTPIVPGRNLLSHGNRSSMPMGMIEGAVPPSSEIHDDKGTMVDVDDVRPSVPGHSPGIGHAFINKNGPGKKF